MQNEPSTRRERENRYCGHYKRSTEHLKEVGEREFKCQPCEERKKLEAGRQKGAGI